MGKVESAWRVRKFGEDRGVIVHAALWYDARELGSKIFACSPMDLEAEEVEKDVEGG